MSDWVVRTAVSEDEGCIASMWLRQLARGQDARSIGMKDATQSASDAQLAYWELHQPIVTALIRSARVLVACDPDRVDYAPGRPSVIWAWSVTSDTHVYGFGVKRRVAMNVLDMARDIARDLFGKAIDEPRRVAFDMPDLDDLGVTPARWQRARSWASSLRQVSERILDADEEYTAVVRHLVDPKRERWQPNEVRRRVA